MKILFILLFIFISNQETYGEVRGFTNQYLRYCHCGEPGKNKCNFLYSSSNFLEFSRDPRTGWVGLTFPPNPNPA